MPRWPTLCRLGGHFCLCCVGRLLLWSFWLVLVLTLGLGIWIASNPRLKVPTVLLRQLEAHLSSAPLRATIGGLVFSNEGELVASDLRFYLEGFDSPICVVETAHTSIDPWAVLSGQPGAQRLELSGAQLILPPQLSPDGSALPFVDDLDLALSYGDHQWRIHRLNAVSAGLSLRVEGALDDSALRPKTQTSTKPELAPLIVNALRKASLLYPKLNGLGRGWLKISLLADPKQAAQISLSGGLAALELPTASQLEAYPLSFVLEPLPLLLTHPVDRSLFLHSGPLRSPKASLDKLTTRLSFRLDPDLSLSLTSLQITLPSVSNKWIPLEGVSLGLRPAKPLTLTFPLSPAALTDAVKTLKVEADFNSLTAGNLTAVQATVLLDDLSAELHARTELDSNIVSSISRIVGRDVLRFCSFTQHALFDGSISLGPRGKLRLAEGWAFADNIENYHVPISHVTGHVHFDGSYFLADQAYVRMGDYFARGSYDMDVHTRDFRLLLRGSLRPAYINPWFKFWWPGFWASFEFPGQAPIADVDVNGRWGHAGTTYVFVEAEALKGAYHSVSTERVHTRLAVTPTSVRALEMNVWRPEGFVRGSFNRHYDPVQALWTKVEFEASGTANHQDAASLLGPEATALASNFVFEKAPSVQLKGWVNGPGAPEGPGHHVAFVGGSEGKTTLFRFPLSKISAKGTWDGPDLQLPNFEATLAEGKLSGAARVDTTGTEHKMEFAGTLTEAKLGTALNTLETHLALLNNTDFTPDPKRLPGTFLSLTLSAAGRYDDIYSFFGKGSGHIWGDELAKVRLLGGLSQLLSFTSLRFTGAKAEFELQGPKAHFSSVRLIGHNSAIDGYGNLILPSQTLDFNAKVWPFDQTNGLIQSTLGLVLAPLSHAFEVKLSGTLGNPTWAFVYNPFRSTPAEPTPEAVQPKATVAPKP